MRCWRNNIVEWNSNIVNMRQCNTMVAACFCMVSAVTAMVLWRVGLSLGRAVFIAVNGATFCLYGFDKYQAIRLGARVPETMLHLVAAVGGTPGAALGQLAFRHKTRKRSFRVAFFTIAATQAIGLTLLWRWMRAQP